MKRQAEVIRRWREDPVAFVREVFRAEPDAWQADVLAAFPNNRRIAMKACKGPGKTTVEAWMAWNFLLTRPHPKIAATSITGDNLSDNLWPEMAKWQQRSELLKGAFEWTATRIYARDHRETWWMSARTWPRGGDTSQQANTLAGLHADYLLFILDESGGIPDAVMAAAEAGLSTGIECKIIQAGNPTHLEGPLYRACTSEAHLWHVAEITADPDDPKRTPRVSEQWAREQIEKYGRDNPWVLVNVFGKFPPSSINALIGPDEVREAMGRQLVVEQYGHAPRVMGVDVARFGDDASVIVKRQGLAVFAPIVMRNLRSDEGAGRVAAEWQAWQADACFVDATGGYGAGWCDALRQLGRTPIEVQFAATPIERRYANKRTEMYFTLVEWVRSGGALPNVPELVAELCAHTYTFRGDRLALEEKDLVKRKIGRSPDHSDGLGLTFAYPVAPGLSPLRRLLTAAGPRGDYDPFDYEGPRRLGDYNLWVRL